MKVYHVKGTRSIRIIWLCAELDLQLEVETIPRFDAEFKASPEWRAKSPTGKVPVFEDGEMTIFESGAIVQYLLDRYGNGNLVPAVGSSDHPIYLQWFWFAEATFARPLGDIAQNTRIKPPEERIAAVIPDARARALLCLDAVDQCVAKQEYLVSSGFTAADIMMGYTLHLAKNMGVFEDNHPSAETYFNRLLTRPAFQSALAA